ncbi:methyltransferase domain-containing protein [Colletotrichum scovillei]|nr:methyltransferase domain-containing protein [Colletotrichum scovillei]
MVKFIEAHVAIAREGPEQPQLDDRLVEAAKLEISNPAFRAYYHYSLISAGWLPQ